MNSDTLQNTLYNLAQSDALSNPAYKTLLLDYTNYHAVLFIEGGIFTLLLIVLSVYFWRQFKRTQMAGSHGWTFEKKTYFSFGLISTLIALFMFLIVAANLSNVLNPQEGFAQSIPDLGTPQAGTQKAVLYQAVNIWARSGSAYIPSILQNEVRDRLSWQQPKAIICSILLVIFAVLTARIWKKLIEISRSSAARWGLAEKALIAIGMLAVPVTLLLMIMALANTQASFAPIMLTLLFS
ncbi:MAG: hypothetical protein HY863_08390 [Chloroflexi bacterium]|nr:hypothetical protein [Chloroflexota bacterium]